MKTARLYPSISDQSPTARGAPLNEISWRSLVQCATQSALDLIPYEISRKLQILPLALISGAEPVLTVLANRTLSIEEGRELKFVAGTEIILETTHVPEISKAIEAAYNGSSRALCLAVSNLPIPENKTSDKIDVGKLPIPALLNSLLKRGYSLGASDLHLEPRSESCRIRYRVDGSLKDEKSIALSPETLEQITRRIKILSGIDTLKISCALDGSFTFASGDTNLSIRVSCVPLVTGEKLVLRFVPVESDNSPLEKLGLSSNQLVQLKTALLADSGCIFLSGPTGSGKTTLLYSALEQIRKSELNIVTIEDPVERRLRDINQSQVNESLTYSKLLRALLRQDPDVIMIGEIRDAETASAALTAAITGHLVLSTVHASNVYEIITRLRQLVSDLDLLSTPLRLLVSQRLLPQNCPFCAKDIKTSDAFHNFFALEPTVRLVRSEGCIKCQHTGLQNRLAVFEMLPINEIMRSAIRGSCDKTEFLSIAREVGYLPYQFQVRELMLNGAISPQTALRALGIPEDLNR